ncbi:MAG: PAS domain S-box protein [Patescibacteria group bacterium]
MKQCINCLSENVSTVVEKNHIFYYCSNCGEKNTRVIDNDGQNYSTKENGLIKHVTIGAIIEKKDNILLIKRQKFPYGFGIPTTHLHYEESVEEALSRLFVDKVGLDLKSKKLILHQTLIDPCRYGAELHECYIFRCKIKDFNFIGTSQASLVWQKKDGLKDVDLISNAKIILSRINFFEKNENPIIHADINRTTRLPESSIIDTIPFSIITFDKKNNPTFTNNTAEKMLSTLKRANNKKYDKFIKSLSEISSRAISEEYTISNIIKNQNQSFNIIANPLINNGKICGSTLVVKDITKERRQEAHNVLSYQTSLALSSESNHTNIIKTMLKQMFIGMDIIGASLMVPKSNCLKVIFSYSDNDDPKHKPLSLKIGTGAAGYVAQNKTILAIPNTEKDPLFIPFSHHKARSLLSIPVIYNNKLRGVLNLTKSKNHFFSEDETKTASIVANRIAQAMEYEKLYQQLDNERETFEKVLETTTDGLIMVDRNFNLIFTNEAAIKLLPLKKNDLENKSINHYLSELNEANSKNMQITIQKSIKNKKTYNMEFVSKKRTGDRIKCQFNPVIEKNNRCNSVLIGFSDTTKLVKKQETVKKQIEQLTGLFRISSLSISSPNFYSNVLKKTATILDSKVADLYFLNPKDDKIGLVKNENSEIPSLIAQIMERKNFKDEFICNDAKNNFDNINNISRIILTPIKLNNETIGFLYAINKEKKYNSRDIKWLSIIAERIASRMDTAKLFKQIRQDEQQLKNIIDNSGDGIIVFDSKDKIMVWNKAMELITGFESSDIFLRNNTDIVLKYKKIKKDILENKTRTVYREVRSFNSDQQEQWLGITLSFIFKEDDFDYVIAIIRDISKEKTMEDRNKEFIYTTTHELRTPITAIKGYLSMILSGDAGEINPRQKLYFDKVYQATDKLVILVEDLLKTARIEENKTVFDKIPFSSTNLMKDVIADFEQKAADKNINLKIAVASKNIKLIGDYDKTKQALSNLVDNAIKYTLSGDIILRNERLKNLGGIVVEDTGVGIPKKDQAAIFNKFYRVQNSESIKAGGTGLGLFIVKNLIEKQGGKVQVTSRLGKGSSISILLPLAN